MLKKILLGVAVVIALLVAFIASRPNEFTVTRSAMVNAPADVVYAQLSDFHSFDKWSPWSALDPNLKPTFEGTPGAVGHGYAWDGNDEVGAGKMTLTEVAPNDHVTIALEFIRPFPSRAEIRWEMKPEGQGQKVSWVMKGPHTFMSKAMCLVKDMDAMIGPDFEKGLASMKLAAAQPVKAAEPVVVPAAATAQPVVPTAAQ